ncbi:MAG: hypothetical protein VB878_14205, partial [Pirellulaceae bacterium]
YATLCWLIAGLKATLSTNIEADEANKSKAAKFPGFTLEDVAIAKVIGKTDEEKKISILLNGFDRRDKVAVVIETALRQEKRTRVVIVNGKQEKQTYEVAVPVRTRRYDVTNLLTVQDSRRHKFAINQIKVWDVPGKSDLPRCELRDNHS